jgi:multiple antibiotic resistance protein
MLETFLLAFIPLFIAIDPIGTLPLYLGLTEGFSASEKKTLAGQAVLTALVIGVTFGALGSWVFKLLGITDADFRIGGGLLLLIFSIREIFGASIKRSPGQQSDKLIGVVPLGIPLIAGPAMITTVLILHETHTFPSVLGALIANLAIVLFILIYSEEIVKKVGEVTPRVVAKVVAIFLAAIAVMMIRRGLEAVLRGV